MADIIKYSTMTKKELFKVCEEMGFTSTLALSSFKKEDLLKTIINKTPLKQRKRIRGGKISQENILINMFNNFII